MKSIFSGSPVSSARAGMNLMMSAGNWNGYTGIIRNNNQIKLAVITDDRNFKNFTVCRNT